MGAHVVVYDVGVEDQAIGLRFDGGDHPRGAMPQQRDGMTTVEIVVCLSLGVVQHYAFAAHSYYGELGVGI